MLSANGYRIFSTTNLTKEFKNSVRAHEPTPTLNIAPHDLDFRGSDPERTLGDQLTAFSQFRYGASSNIAPRGNFLVKPVA